MDTVTGRIDFNIITPSFIYGGKTGYTTSNRSLYYRICPNTHCIENSM